jgi:hypothetical protein
MKKIRLPLLFLLAALTAQAQTLSPKVTPTAGGHATGSNGVSLSYTIGETLTPTLSAGGKILSQGQQQPEINLLASSTMGELCAGGPITVGFTAASYVAAPNVFTLQLSDASGNFGSPVSLATLSGTASGSLAGVIPPNTVVGSGYRVRVVSSQPYFVGSSLPVPVCTCVAPTVACPDNVTVNAAPNQCASTANWTVPTPAGNCSPTLAGTASPNATVFPVGVSIVTYTATNGRDIQSGTCSFSVTVVDDQNPSIVCPSNIVRNTDANQCSAVVTYTTPSFSDNCSGASVTRTGGLASGSAFPKGANMVEWKAADAAGLSSICQFTVTVSDAQAPSITCPANIVRNTDLNQCGATVAYTTPTFSDNCAGSSVSQTSGGASGSFFQKGTNTVIWKAVDGTGLSSTCSFTVTVNDGQAPAITCPSNQTKNTDTGLCTAAATYPMPTFTDNCTGGEVSIQSGLPSGSNFPKGTNTVIWKATDVAGLTKTCSFRITVNDAQAPVISCPTLAPTTTTANSCLSAPVTYATPTATDNCPGAVTVLRLSGPTSGSQFPLGTTNVTWRAIDAAGRSSTCSFAVTVTDAAPPAITCPNSLSATGSGNPCSAVVTYATLTATDNCGVQSLALLSGLNSGSVFPAGATVNVWRAVDNAGLSSTCSFTVTVGCGAGSSEFEVRSLKFEVRSSELPEPSPKPTSNSELQTLNFPPPSPEPTSNFKLQTLNFTLSPNPATSEVQIFVENLDAAGGELAVHNAAGRLMWRQTVRRPSPAVSRQSLVIQVADFAAGVYFVTLRSGGQALTERFVKTE